MYLATYESVPEEGQPAVKGQRNVGITTFVFKRPMVPY